MDIDSANQIAIAAAGLVLLTGYSAFILVPAWGCYGRLWEKVAASFLTLFILAALLMVGIAIGFGVVYFYDEYA